MFHLTNKVIYNKILSFQNKYDILNSDENTVTCHLTSICWQMALTEKTSKNQR